ncbi:MAG: hypothetical protein QOF69_3352, partial [Solirubrobacteraceae bacterium]|nr:hypothetical protein [Solirubrobacteraceae bacterium]
DVDVAAAQRVTQALKRAHRVRGPVDLARTQFDEPAPRSPHESGRQRLGRECSLSGRLPQAAERGKELPLPQSRSAGALRDAGASVERAVCTGPEGGVMA